MDNMYRLLNTFLLNKVPAGESIKKHKYRVLNQQVDLIERLASSDKTLSRTRNNFQISKEYYKQSFDMNTSLKVSK